MVESFKVDLGVQLMGQRGDQAGAQAAFAARLS